MYVYIWEYANPCKLTYAWWVFSLGFIFYVQKVENISIEEMENGHSCCWKWQKTLQHNKKLRKVNSAIEAREMFLLQYEQKISLVCSIVPWTLDLMFVYKLVVAKWDLGAYFAGASCPTSSLEKV